VTFEREGLVHLDKRQLVTIALIIITLSSISVATAYSNNYYAFYPALQKLQLNNPTMSFAPTNNSLNAYAIFTVENPTSYSGLAMAEFEPSFQVYAANGSLIPAGNFIEYIPPRDSLDPGKTFSYNISFTGSGAGVYQIYQMVKNQGVSLSQFNFNFTVALLLSTFLQTFTSIRAVYVCNTHLGGGSCLQVAVILNSSPTPSTGGGGI
jgi:hypothetical protein